MNSRITARPAFGPSPANSTIAYTNTERIAVAISMSCADEAVGCFGSFPTPAGRGAVLANDRTDFGLPELVHGQADEQDAKESRDHLGRGHLRLDFPYGFPVKAAMTLSDLPLNPITIRAKAKAAMISAAGFT